MSFNSTANVFPGNVTIRLQPQKPSRGMRQHMFLHQGIWNSNVTVKCF